LPILKNSAPLGPIVPGGVTAGRTYTLPPLLYPRNDDPGSRAQMVPPTTVVEFVAGLPSASGMTFKSVVLKHFSKSGIYTHGMRTPVIDDDRLIYEVAVKFAWPTIAPSGSIWASGIRTYIVDGATGKLFGMTTSGNRLSLPIGQTSILAPTQ
jgi:hypothetical protein